MSKCTHWNYSSEIDWGTRGRFKERPYIVGYYSDPENPDLIKKDIHYLNMVDAYRILNNVYVSGLNNICDVKQTFKSSDICFSALEIDDKWWRIFALGHTLNALKEFLDKEILKYNEKYNQI